jgi:hypothetical protein
VPVTLRKLVTGGQTGVDRGALDAALERGFPCGGWCPEGRLTEDGPLPPHYPLRELPGGTTADRTERNVRDSDATLILTPGPLTGGTRLTRECCERLQRPFLELEWNAERRLDSSQEEPALERIRSFLDKTDCELLNVAGPRASEWPGAYQTSAGLVGALLDTL